MSLVLISFLGAAQRGGEAANPADLRYRRTRYGFPADGARPAHVVQTSLFGAALWKHLQEANRKVERWLVLGTDQSMWDALVEALPESERESVPGPLFARVSRAFHTGISEPLPDADALLLQWGAAVSSALGSTCTCRRVGTGRDDASWEDHWSALAEAVEDGDELVLDVTNGLRHQPVIAAFMVMLLRRLRSIAGVELYYGAFELRDHAAGTEAVSPVLHLTLSNRLLEATEAIATLEYSGNFIPLARGINLPPHTQAEVEAVAFLEETNQEARAQAQTLLTELAKGGKDAIDTELANALREPLQWVAGQSLPRRLGQKAEFAFRHRQYSKAVMLLHEAIAAAAAHRYGGAAGTSAFQERDTAMRDLANDRELLPRSRDRDLVKDLKALRNAIAHGTPTTRPRPQRALSWPQARDPATGHPAAFRALFADGQVLLQSLLAKLSL